MLRIATLLAYGATVALLACGPSDSNETLAPSSAASSPRPIAVPDEEPDDLPAQLAPGVFPLAGTDVGLPTADLEVLRAAIGDRSVIGLGESVHTSAGYNRMRVRLIRYLVEELGVRAIAMETEWGLARVATDYVETCSGSSSDATKSLLFVFQDQVPEGRLQVPI